VDDPQALAGKVRERMEVAGFSGARVHWRWQEHRSWEELWKQGLGFRRITDRIAVAQAQVSESLARVGARSARLETRRAALEQSEQDLTLRLSEVQDADTIRVLSDLVREETALQAALQVTARVVQPSLLDFLR